MARLSSILSMESIPSILSIVHPQANGHPDRGRGGRRSPLPYQVTGWSMVAPK